MFLLFIHGSKKAAGDGVFCGFDAVFGPHQILHQALRYTHVLGEILINSYIYSMELIITKLNRGLCIPTAMKARNRARSIWMLSDLQMPDLWVFILLCSHNGVCHSLITKPLDQLRAR